MSDVNPRPLLFETRALTKTYASPVAPVVVLEDLNWGIPRGRLVAVIGPSGAGKSTLLHLLGGLDRPTGGAVIFGDRNIFDLNPRELADFRNRRIGFVFQFHHL